MKKNPFRAVLKPHQSLKHLLATLFMALLSACATQKDMQQIETKVDVLSTKATESKSEMSSTLKQVESKVDVLAESKSEISSSLGDVLLKQESFEKWQKSAEERFKVFLRNQADLKADLDSIDRKINGLNGSGEETQHWLKKLDGRMAKLDERLRELYLMIADAGMEQQLKSETFRRDTAAALAQIKDDLAALRGTAAPQKKKAEKTPPPAKKATPVIEAPKKDDGKKASSATPAAGQPGRSADELYGGGYTNFLKGDFAAAEMEFAEFVKRFPDTELAGNAQYWMAETLANQGKIKEALGGFSDTVTRYPRAAKAATALWRAAELAEKSGDHDKAREFLRKIVDNYPTSYEAAMVEDKMKTLDGAGN